MTAELLIDLSMFRQNLRRVRAEIAPADLMLVVKDDAYGHGLERMVAAAAEDGVRWFGAFDVATGVRVREHCGDCSRIFAWMVSGVAEVRAASAADLDVGVGTEHLLEEIAEHAGRTSSGGRLRLHLKVDTGLHRNGVRPERWDAFCTRAAALEAGGLIEVVGIWSHIAEASDAEDDQARAVFEDAVARARAAGLRPTFLHLAASAAGYSRPGYRFDLVRIGAYCYGIRPAGEPQPDGLRPIATLRAQVVVSTPAELGLEIGALDGLPSSLAGRLRVRLAGKEVTVEEVTETETVIRGQQLPILAIGEHVVIYGDDGVATSPTDLAEKIGTIGEEIAVRLSPLVRRRGR